MDAIIDTLNDMAIRFMSVYNPQFFCEVIVPMATGFLN